jgi:hypothetical protein
MLIRFTTGASEARHSLSAPTRTRTRDSSLGPRCDRPLHHQGDSSGRQGIRTPIPRGETALAVRPGQPYPATFPISAHSGPPGSRTPISWLQARCRTVRPAAQKNSCDSPVKGSHGEHSTEAVSSLDYRDSSPLGESSRRESNPRSLFVREVSSPLDHGTLGFAFFRFGCESPAMSQAPVPSRARRPYESRLDTCHAWGLFVREQTERRSGESRTAARLDSAGAEYQRPSSLDGTRTRFSTLRGWCPGR